MLRSTPKLLLAALLACGCGSQPTPGPAPMVEGDAAGSSATPLAGSGPAAGMPSGGQGGSGAGSTSGGGGQAGGSAGAGAGGSAGSTSGGGGAELPYILGADVSWLLEDEAAGASYYDGGVKLELLTLLKARGFNFIRVRTFVDPSAPEGYAAGKPEAWCDLAHTIELAQRVKQLGMGLLLDFHYSDNWADPGQQRKPAAWAALPFAELVEAVHDYTHDTISALVAAGVTPDMVQVGNEITPGMLFPDGSSEQSNWPQLAQLLKAGASAVHEVDPSIRIMLHIEKGGDNATTRWWVDQALAQGVPLQILGQSCYTEFQGTPEDWQANFDDLVTRYPDLDFVIAEYSHEKRRANDIMFGLPDRRGLGTFIWEPTRWMESIFDRDGQRYDGNQHLETFSQIASDFGVGP
jgi:arabinogalactan endo-1,4-beta-galactosidase